MSIIEASRLNRHFYIREAATPFASERQPNAVTLANGKTEYLIWGDAKPKLGSLVSSIVG